MTEAKKKRSIVSIAIIIFWLVCAIALLLPVVFMMFKSAQSGTFWEITWTPTKIGLSLFGALLVTVGLYDKLTKNVNPMALGAIWILVLGSTGVLIFISTIAYLVYRFVVPLLF